MPWGAGVDEPVTLWGADAGHEVIPDESLQPRRRASYGLKPVPMPKEDAPPGMANPQWNDTTKQWNDAPQTYVKPGESLPPQWTMGRLNSQEALPGAPAPIAPAKPGAIFGGQYPNPDLTISSSTGQPVAKSWQPLPASKAELKDGNWYRLRKSDGTEYSAIWHEPNQGFYPLDVAQTQPEPGPHGVVAWSDAVNQAHAGGWDTPGSKDEANDYAKLSEPEKLERQMEQLPGGTNPIMGPIYQGLLQGGAEASGVLAHVLGNPEMGDQMLHNAATVGQAGNIRQGRNPSVIDSGTQDAIAGGIDFAGKLALGGGSFTGYKLTSATAAYYRGAQEAKEKGFSPIGQTAYAFTKAITDVATNTAFEAFGAPQKEIADAIKGEVSEGVTKAISSAPEVVAKGIAVAAPAGIVNAAIDKISGMNPDALSAENIGKTLQSAIASQIVFAGYSHFLGPLLEHAPEIVHDAIDNPNAANVKKLAGEFIRGNLARQKFVDNVKEVVDHPEQWPDAGTLEGSATKGETDARGQQQVDATAQSSPTPETGVRGEASPASNEAPSPRSGAAEAARAQQAVEPPQPPNTVRMYHGGDMTTGGKRWLTPQRSYAEYHAEKSGSGVSYVDVPENHPSLTKAFDDSGTNQQSPYNSFEASEEIAKQLKPIGEQNEQQQQNVRPTASGEVRRTVLEPATESGAQVGNGRNSGEGQQPASTRKVLPPEIANASEEDLRSILSQMGVKKGYGKVQSREDLVGKLTDMIGQKSGPNAEAMNGIQFLSDRYGKQVNRVEPQTDIENDAHDFLKERGYNPVFVKHADGSDMPARGYALGKSVFIRSGQEGNQLWEAVGHEIAHASGFDAGNKIDEVLISGAADRYMEKTTPEYRSQLENDPAMRRKEGVAQLVGEFMSSPEFRQRIGQESPGLWGRIKDTVLKTLGKFKPEDAAAQETLRLLRKTAAPEATPAGALQEMNPDTAAKNASMAQDRQAINLSDLAPRERESYEKWQDEAVQQGIPGRALQIATEVIAKPRAMTPQETVGFDVRASELKSQFADFSKQLEAATDTGQQKQIAATINSIQQEFDQLSTALYASGTRASYSMLSRKLAIDKDFTPLSVKSRFAAVKGEAPTAEESLKLTKMAQDLQKGSDKAEALDKEIKQRKETKAVNTDKQVDELLDKMVNDPKAKYPTKKAVADLQEHVGNLDLPTKPQTPPDLEAEKVSLQKKIDDAGVPTDLNRLAQKLARHFVEQGVHEREPLVDAVHGELTKAFPDLTKRQTMDAVSGYGDFKKLSKDEVSVKLRDLKGQLQQVGKLTDMAEGRAPLKSGIERREPSDTERDLIKQVNEAKKKGGYDVTDAQSQLKSYVDSQTTRLNNEIKEWQRRLDEGDYAPKTKAEPPKVESLEALRTERDRIKKEFLDKDPNPPAIQKAKARLAELQQHLNNGTVPDVNPRPQSASQDLADLNDKIAAVRKALGNSEPALRKRYEQQFKDLTDRLKENKFPDPTKKDVTPMSKELEALDFNNDLMRRKIQTAIRNARPHTIPERIVDMATWWRRQSLLTSPLTLAKLTAASATELTITPAQEAVGGVIAKALPSFARRLETESASSIKIEAQSLAKAMTHFASDAAAKLKHGATDFEMKSGTKVTIPDEMHGFFGNLHGAIKTPVVRQGYERSLTKLLQVYSQNGVNIDDPMVQMQASARALAEANRQIFMEDNVVANAMQRAASAFNQIDTETGKPKVSGLAGKAVMRTVFPIVRIPTNIVSRVFQATLGLPVGATRLGIEFAKGIDNLPPGRADVIMRQLKAGSLGAAFLLYGYYNHQNVGGYYQPGEKRDPKDVPAGATRIFGHDVPAYVQANPFLITMQLGATIGRVAESFASKTDTKQQGLGKGVEAATLGTLAEVPMMRDARDLGKLFDPNQRDKFLQQYGESLVVPAGAKWLYKQVYPDAPKQQKPNPPAQSPDEHVRDAIKLLQKESKINADHPPKTPAGYQRKADAAKKLQEVGK